MKETRRKHSGATHTPAGTANDIHRVERALESASRWLRRRGSSRENTKTRRVYSEAAKRVHELAKAS